MYLNILEYVDDVKQEELMEMIDVEAKSEGVIAGLVNKGIEKGKEQGEKSIILELLENYSIEDVSAMIHKDVDYIREIIK